MNFVYRRYFAGPVQAVIFDWAGTTVDFGCFAPAQVFIDVFKKMGVDVTMEQAREPMGLAKRDHIKAIAAMPSVAAQWQDAKGHIVTEEEIDEMYKLFIPRQVEVIPHHADVVPGLQEIVEELRERGLKIGSTTGYNKEMTDTVMEAAEKQGFTVDAMACASDVTIGRPAPFMALKNLIDLGVYPAEGAIKIGDTIPDIEEGLNAGMWSVGVVDSSNEMGLTMDELGGLSLDERELRRERIRTKFFKSGAHYVIDSMEELPMLIDEIDERLVLGELP